MVSWMALMSNTPGRAGMMTMVAFFTASSTTADMFGGVSMNTYSKPSRLAALTSSLTDRVAGLILRSSLPRSLCHNVSEPCGSASINRQGLLAL